MNNYCLNSSVYSVGESGKRARPSLREITRINANTRVGSGLETTHIRHRVAPWGTQPCIVRPCFFPNDHDGGPTPNAFASASLQEWQPSHSPFRSITCISPITWCDRFEMFVSTTVTSSHFPFPHAILLTAITSNGPRSGLKLMSVKTPANPSATSTHQAATLVRPAIISANRTAKIDHCKSQ